MPREGLNLRATFSDPPLSPILLLETCHLHCVVDLHRDTPYNSDGLVLLRRQGPGWLDPAVRPWRMHGYHGACANHEQPLPFGSRFSCTQTHAPLTLHPSIGFGTATLFHEQCTASVRAAIRSGYRHIDTALLYNCQAAVGKAIAEAIAAGEVTREELFVTTKVSFYPPGSTGVGHFAPICFNPNNVKGAEVAGIAECLQLLGLDYVDLLLIHNPCVGAEGVGALVWQSHVEVPHPHPCAHPPHSPRAQPH